MHGVDKASIQTTMDGKPYVKWSGETSALSQEDRWAVSPAGFGFGAWDSRITIGSAKLRILSGAAQKSD